MATYESPSSQIDIEDGESDRQTVIDLTSPFHQGIHQGIVDLSGSPEPSQLGSDGIHLLYEAAHKGIIDLTGDDEEVESLGREERRLSNHDRFASHRESSREISRLVRELGRGYRPGSEGTGSAFTSYHGRRDHSRLRCSRDPITPIRSPIRDRKPFFTVDSNGTLVRNPEANPLLVGSPILFGTPEQQLYDTPVTNDWDGSLSEKESPTGVSQFSLWENEQEI